MENTIHIDNRDTNMTRPYIVLTFKTHSSEKNRDTTKRIYWKNILIGNICYGIKIRSIRSLFNSLMGHTKAASCVNSFKE